MAGSSFETRFTVTADVNNQTKKGFAEIEKDAEKVRNEIERPIDVKFDKNSARLDDLRRQIDGFIEGINGIDFDKFVSLFNELYSNFGKLDFNKSIGKLFEAMNAFKNGEGDASKVIEQWKKLIGMLDTLQRLQDKISEGKGKNGFNRNDLNQLTGIQNLEPALNSLEQILDKVDDLQNKTEALQSKAKRFREEYSSIDAEAYIDRRISAQSGKNVTPVSELKDFASKFDVDTVTFKRDLFRPLLAMVKVYNELADKMGELNEAPNQNAEGVIKNKIQILTNLQELVSQMQSAMMNLADDKDAGLNIDKIRDVINSQVKSIDGFFKEMPQSSNKVIQEINRMIGSWIENMTADAKNSVARMKENYAYYIQRQQKRETQLHQNAVESNVNRIEVAKKEYVFPENDENAKNTKELNDQLSETARQVERLVGMKYGVEELGKQFAIFRKNAEAQGIKESDFGKYFSNYEKYKHEWKKLADNYERDNNIVWQSRTGNTFLNPQSSNDNIVDPNKIASDVEKGINEGLSRTDASGLQDNIASGVRNAFQDGMQHFRDLMSDINAFKDSPVSTIDEVLKQYEREAELLKKVHEEYIAGNDEQKSAIEKIVGTANIKKATENYEDEMSGLQRLIDLYSQLQSSIKSMEQFEGFRAGNAINPKEQIGEIETYIATLKELRSLVGDNNLASMVSQPDVDQYIKSLETQRDFLKGLSADQVDVSINKEKLASDIQSGIEQGEYNVNTDGIGQSMSQSIGNAVTENSKIAIEQIKEAVASIRLFETFPAETTEEEIEKLEKIKEKVDSIKEASKGIDQELFASITGGKNYDIISKSLDEQISKLKEKLDIEKQASNNIGQTVTGDFNNQAEGFGKFASGIEEALTEVFNKERSPKVNTEQLVSDIDSALKQGFGITKHNVKINTEDIKSIINSSVSEGIDTVNANINKPDFQYRTENNIQPVDVPVKPKVPGDFTEQVAAQLGEQTVEVKVKPSIQEVNISEIQNAFRSLSSSQIFDAMQQITGGADINTNGILKFMDDLNAAVKKSLSEFKSNEADISTEVSKQIESVKKSLSNSINRSFMDTAKSLSSDGNVGAEEFAESFKANIQDRIAKSFNDIAAKIETGEQTDQVKQSVRSQVEKIRTSIENEIKQVSLENIQSAGVSPQIEAGAVTIPVNAKVNDVDTSKITDVVDTLKENPIPVSASIDFSNIQTNKLNPESIAKIAEVLKQLQGIDLSGLDLSKIDFQKLKTAGVDVEKLGLIVDALWDLSQIGPLGMDFDKIDFSKLKISEKTVNALNSLSKISFDNLQALKDIDLSKLSTNGIDPRVLKQIVNNFGKTPELTADGKIQGDNTGAPVGSLRELASNKIKDELERYADSLKNTSESLDEERNVISESIKEIRRFYDSNDNLVRVIVQSVQEVEEEGKRLLKTIHTSINYDANKGEVYRSHVDSIDYQRYSKLQGQQYTSQLKEHISELNNIDFKGIDASQLERIAGILESIDTIEERIKNNNLGDFVNSNVLRNALELKNTFENLFNVLSLDLNNNPEKLAESVRQLADQFDSINFKNISDEKLQSAKEILEGIDVEISKIKENGLSDFVDDSVLNKADELRQKLESILVGKIEKLTPNNINVDNLNEAKLALEEIDKMVSKLRSEDRLSAVFNEQDLSRIEEARAKYGELVQSLDANNLGEKLADLVRQYNSLKLESNFNETNLQEAEKVLASIKQLLDEIGEKKLTNFVDSGILQKAQNLESVFKNTRDIGEMYASFKDLNIGKNFSTEILEEAKRLIDEIKASINELANTNQLNLVPSKFVNGVDGLESAYIHALDKNTIDLYKQASSALDELIQKFVEYARRSEEERSNDVFSSELSNVQRLAELAGSAYQELGDKASAAAQKAREAFAWNGDGNALYANAFKGTMLNGIDKVIDSGKVSPQGLAGIENYKKSVDELYDKIKSLNGNFIDVISNEENNEAKSLLETIDKIYTRHDAILSGGFNTSNYNAMKRLESQVATYKGNNPLAAETYKKEFGNLEGIFKNAEKGTMSYKEAIDEVTKSFNNLKVTAANSGNIGESFFSAWSSRMKNLVSYTASFVSFYRVVSMFKNGISTIRALDTALVDLQKTTTMTSGELDKFYIGSNSVAKQMGVSTKQVIEQAAAWSRLGYQSAEAATTMAKVSSQFAAISPGMSTDEATTGLVSIMKAFDIEAEDALEGIASKINIVGNNFATSNAEIVEGLSKSSAAMAAAGNDLDETIALFTAGQEILQNASTMGQSLKTIAMRIRGINEETEETDEGLTNINSNLAELTKTAKTPLGISVMADPDTFKSTTQILREIAAIYDDMTDKKRADMLELLFGKTRVQAGSAILSNWEQVEDAIEKMRNSAGSADAEMSVIENSIDFKINRLKETWTGFWQELISRDSFKNIVDQLTGVSEGIQGIVTTLGPLGTVLAGFTIAPFIKDILTGRISLGNIIVSPATTLVRTFTSLKAVLTGLPVTILAIKAAWVNFWKAFNQAKAAEGIIKGFSIAMTEAASAANTAGHTGISSLLGFLGEKGLVILGVTAALAALTAAGVALYKISKAGEDANKAMKSAAEAFKDTKSHINELNNELDETSSRIEELEGKEFLTFDEQSELEALKATNRELENTIKLEERRAEIQQRDTAKKTEVAIKKNYGDGLNIDKFESEINRLKSVVATSTLDFDFSYDLAKKNNSSIEYLIAYKDRITKNIKSTSAEIESLVEDASEEEILALRNQLDGYQTSLDNVDGKLIEHRDQVKEYLDNLVPDTDRYNEIKQILDLIDKAIDPNLYNKNKVDEIFDSAKFKEQREEIAKLAYEGKLTEDSIEGLADAVRDANLAVGDGENAFDAFRGSMAAEGQAAAIAAKQAEALKDTIYGTVANIESLNSSLGFLNDVFSEQNENGTLSAETLEKLKNSFGSLDGILYETASGIKVNVDALMDLVNTNADEYADDLAGKMESLANTYDSQTSQLNSLYYELATYTDQESDAAKACKEHIDALESERFKTLGQINTLRDAEIALDAYTSSYLAFQRALSTSNQGYQYDFVQSNADNVAKMADQGRFNTDDVRQYMNMFTYEDISTKSVEELRDLWPEVKKRAQEYFTEGREGIDKMYDNIVALAGKMNEADSGVSFENGILNISDMDKVAKALNIDLETLRVSIEKMQEYDDGITFDRSYESLNLLDKTINSLAGRLQSLKQERVEVMFQFQMSHNQQDWDKLQELTAEKNIVNSIVNFSLSEEGRKTVKEIQELEESLKGQPLYAVVDIKAEQKDLADSIGMSVKAALEVDVDAPELLSTIDNLETLKDALDYLSEHSDESTVKINIDGSEAELTTAQIQNKIKELARNAGIPIDQELNVDVNFSNEVRLEYITALLDELSNLDLHPENYALIGDELSDYRENLVGLIDLLAKDYTFDLDTKQALIDVKNLSDKIEEVNASMSKSQSPSETEGKVSIKNDLESQLKEKLGKLGMTKEQALNLYAALNLKTDESKSSIEELKVGIEGLEDPVTVNVSFDTALTRLKTFLDKVQNALSTKQYIDIEYRTVNKPPSPISSPSGSGNSGSNSGNSGSNSGSDGPHAVNGTANAHGSWGIESDEDGTLVGELGREILVRGDHYQTVGDNGPEMIDLKKGDIIFNHKQADDLLKHGHAVGRGKALANGNADDLIDGIFDGNKGVRLSGNSYADGKAYKDATSSSSKSQISIKSSKLGSGNNLGSKSSGAQAAKKATESQTAATKSQTEATKAQAEATKKNTAATENNTASQEEHSQEYDWLERAISGIEKQFDNLESQSQNTYADTATRERFYQELLETADELSDVLTEAVARRQEDYSEQLQNLSKYFSGDELERLIRNIENGNYKSGEWKQTRVYTGLNDGSDAAKAMLEAWEKENDAIDDAISAFDKLEEAQDAAAEAALKHRDKLKELYEYQISNLERAVSISGWDVNAQEKVIDRKQSSGKVVGAQDYRDLVSYSGFQNLFRQNQLGTMQNRLTQLELEAPNSDEYWEVFEAIHDIKEEIQDAQDQQDEWNNAIKDMPLDHISTYISNLKSVNSLIGSYNSMLSASGMSSGTDALEKQIDLQETILDNYQEYADMLSDRLGDFEPGSDKWQETYETLLSVKGEIINVVQEMAEYNKQLMSLPVERLEKTSAALSSIQSSLDSYQSDNEKIIDGVVAVLEEQTAEYEAQQKALEKEKSAIQKIQDGYQDQIDSIKEQQDLIQDEIDELNKEKTAIERASRALSDQIEEHEEEQTRLEREKRLLQDQVDIYTDMQAAIERQNDAIQRQIDSYEEQKTALERSKRPFQNQIDEYEKEQEAIERQSRELSDQIDEYEEEQEMLERSKRENQDLIDQYEKEIELLNRANDRLSDEVQAYEDQKDEIADEIRLLEDQIDVYEKQQTVIERESREMSDQIDLYQDEIELLERAKRPLELQIEDWEERQKIISKTQDELQEEIKTQQRQQTAYQKEQKAINKQIEEYQKQQEQIQKDAEEQIKPLQEQLDILNKQNSARERQLALDQAAYNLQKAREQKTVQVVRNGRIVYEANEDDVRNAQNELLDARYSKVTGELQDEIDYINETADKKVEDIDKLIEPLDKRVEELDDLIEAIDDVIEGYENEIERLDYESKDYDNLIEDANSQIDQYSKQIRSIEWERIEPLQDQIDLNDKRIKELDYLIEPIQDQIDRYNEQSEYIDRYLIEPIEDQIEANSRRQKEYEYMIEPLQDEIDRTTERINYIDRYLIEPLQDQIDAFDKQLKTIDYLIEPIQDKIDEIEERINAIDLNNIEPLQDEIDANNKRIQEYDDLISPIQDLIDDYDDQIEYISRYLIEPLQDQIDAYSKQTKAIDYRIEPLQDRIDAWDEQIDSLQKYIDNYEKSIKSLDDRIDSIQDLIDVNNELADRWENIRTDAERIITIAQAASLAGMSEEAFREKIRAGGSNAGDVYGAGGLYEQTKESYEAISRQQMELSNVSDSLGSVVSMLEQITESFLDGSMTNTKANELMTQIIEMARDGFTGKEKFTAQLAIEDKESLDDMIASVTEAFNQTTSDFAASLKTAQANNRTLSDYTSSFNSFRSEILDMLDDIKDAYENSTTGDYSRWRAAADDDFNERYSDSSNGPGYEITTRTTGNGSQSVNVGSGSSTVNNTTVVNSGGTGSSGGPGQGISSSNGNGGVYTPSNFRHADGIASGAIKKYATGLMQGAVGPSADERVKILQQLALGELKPAEVPSILDVGEVVLNPSQQKFLLGNMGNAMEMQRGITSMAMKANAQTPSFTVTMGDIHVHDVDNGRDFAKAIAMQFKPAITQEFSKMMRHI